MFRWFSGIKINAREGDAHAEMVGIKVNARQGGRSDLNGRNQGEGMRRGRSSIVGLAVEAFFSVRCCRGFVLRCFCGLIEFQEACMTISTRVLCETHVLRGITHTIRLPICLLCDPPPVGPIDLINFNARTALLTGLASPRPTPSKHNRLSYTIATQAV